MLKHVWIVMKREPDPYEAPTLRRVYRLKVDALKFIREQEYPKEHITIKELVY